MSTEVQETEVEIIDNSTAIMALNKSEIDQAIATAKRYPRSITAFKRRAGELACLDEETAASMFYVLPRAGKKIEGPSARLAEVVASSWGNLRAGSRVVSEDAKFVTSQGACFDLETNFSVTYEVRRRITNKDGGRYNDDMIMTTSNAASSIAFRQAVFKVIPFALIKPIYEMAKQTAVGKATSIVERRHREMLWFTKAGATEAQVLSALGLNGIDDITIDDLVTLIGLRNAIKDGNSTIEEALGPAPDTTHGKRVRTSTLDETLAKEPEKPKEETKAKEPETKEPAGETVKEEAKQEDRHESEGPSDYFRHISELLPQATTLNMWFNCKQELANGKDRLKPGEFEELSAKVEAAKPKGKK